jgi:hypothetical protein
MAPVDDGRSIAQITWDGKVSAPLTTIIRVALMHPPQVPVVIHLAGQDTVDGETVDPLYLLLPRRSYLPVIFEQLKRHFQAFVPADRELTAVWLESDSTALRWCVWMCIVTPSHHHIPSHTITRTCMHGCILPTSSNP